MINRRQTLFKKDRSLGWRTLFLVLLALVCMTLDQSNHFFHRLRDKLAIVTLPVNYAVAIPIRAAEDVLANLTSHETLMQENDRLRAKVTLLQASMHKMMAVQSDNQALLSLLQASAKASGKVLEAQIIAVSPDPYQHQVVIDKGSHEGVFEGQPVIDAYGIIGQVVQLGSLTSRVMLITDTQSAIPVQDSRSGVRAIAVGDATNGLLSLQGVPQTTDFKQGDLLIASGLGDRYPFGYPVAQIITVNNDPDQRFSTIYAKPLAHLDRARLVLLIWPSEVKANKAILKSLKAKHASSPKRGGDDG